MTKTGFPCVFITVHPHSHSLSIGHYNNMTLLDNDQFIQQLAELFESARTKGTVYLTQKRCM
jgi:predicted sulfurtransferase